MIALNRQGSNAPQVSQPHHCTIPAGQEPGPFAGRRQWLKLTGTSVLAAPALNLSRAWAQTKTESIGSGKPQHAFLLPPLAGNFGWASQALRAGILAAHQRDGQQRPLLLVECEDRASDLFAVVNDLQINGIEWMAGPLTRNGVNLLIESGATSIKTLSLNTPDPDRPVPSRMLVFGLGVEAEARQIGTVAYDQASIDIPTRRPLIAVAITQANASARRSAAAFIDTWRELGGEIPLPIEVENRPASEIKNAIDPYKPDAVFIAANFEGARNLRPIVDRTTRVYGTSALSPFNSPPLKAMPELEGLTFVEMPWIAAPDSAVSLAYPKAPVRFATEQVRLYALGLDTFRLMLELLPFSHRRVLEGATGRLTINTAQNRVERQLTVVQIRAGLPINLS